MGMTEFDRNDAETVLRYVVLYGLGLCGLDEGIRRGVHDFRMAHGRNWRLLDAGHDRKLHDVFESRFSRFDGIITHVLGESYRETLLRYGCPVINVGSSDIAPEFSHVGADNFAVGEMAADYFLARAYRRFVFRAPSDRSHDRERWAGFSQRVVSEGGTVVRVHGTPYAFEGVGPDAASILHGFDGNLDELLKSIPRPFAAYASSDSGGARMCEILLDTGCRVPEEAAVLGTDNIESVCDCSILPLSSVSVPARKIRYLAAQKLDQEIRGEDSAEIPALAPVGIVERRSSAATAIDDPDVARALAYLHAHAADRITVGEMVKDLNLPRRTVQRKFQDLLGRTPLQELYRRRVEIASHALAQTEEPVYTIAVESGFTDAESMAAYFKKALGLTPSAYREKVRGR